MVPKVKMQMSSFNIIHCFHRMNGFANALTFKDIDDEDIEAVEHFVKTQTFKILSNKILSSDSTSADCDVLVECEQMINYFGEVYKEAPKHFKFLAGDRKLIKRLVEYVKQAVDGNGVNTGLKLFKPKQNASKQAKTAVARKTKNTIVSNDCDASNLDEQLPHLKLDLFTRVMEWLNDHKADQQIPISSISPDIISVTVENGQIFGYIRCVLCQNKPNGGKGKPKKIAYRFDKGSQYWISSNFITHLRSAHGLSAEKKITKKKRQADITTKTADESKLMTNCDESVQIVEDNVTFPQLKEHGLYDQISKQITAMSQAVLENNEVEHTISIELPETKFTNIKVVAADPDGNCLFKSLAHQLFRSKMESDKIKGETKQLRAEVVSHIKQNTKLYEHAIKGRVYDNIENRKMNGELSDSDSIDMEREIEFFVNRLLPVNRYWGGSESLNAVSDLYNVNILVFLENGSFNLITTAEMACERTIAVAFRLDNIDGINRNHYDSVTDILSDDIFALAG